MQKTNALVGSQYCQKTRYIKRIYAIIEC